MALYIGNIELGNENYLGNIKIPDSSIFVPPIPTLTVEYILIGGGGGGGRLGGGGGGGAVITGSFSLQPGVNYAVIEGAGGITANSGSPTTAFGITALGGAAGAGTNGNATSGLGNGGGGSAYANTSIQTGSIGLYGFNGGDGSYIDNANGGGGGAAANGEDGVAGQSGRGGAPLSISYYTSTVQAFYSASAGGGGAGTSTSTRGLGGSPDGAASGGALGLPGNPGRWPGGGAGGHGINDAVINRYGAMGYVQLMYDGPLNNDVTITGTGFSHVYNASINKTYIRFVPPIDPITGGSYTFTIQYK